MRERNALQTLIETSTRALSKGIYTDAEAETALLVGAMGVDTTLIVDGTYFVIETQDGVRAACGGWSARKTLFGGDGRAGREDAAWANPETDPAKIRAFFVHPDFARRGLGRMLMAVCEKEARAAGFKRLELMATLPGIPLYDAMGFARMPQIEYPLTETQSIRLVPMYKNLSETS